MFVDLLVGIDKVVLVYSIWKVIQFLKLKNACFLNILSFHHFWIIIQYYILIFQFLITYKIVISSFPYIIHLNSFQTCKFPCVFDVFCVIFWQNISTILHKPKQFNTLINIPFFVPQNVDSWGTQMLI